MVILIFGEINSIWDVWMSVSWFQLPPFVYSVIPLQPSCAITHAWPQPSSTVLSANKFEYACNTACPNKHSDKQNEHTTYSRASQNSHQQKGFFVHDKTPAPRSTSLRPGNKGVLDKIVVLRVYVQCLSLPHCQQRNPVSKGQFHCLSLHPVPEVLLAKILVTLTIG